MKTRKQWIAMLLMLAMLFTALPIAAFAEDEPAPQEEQEESTPQKEENAGETSMKPMQAPPADGIPVRLFWHEGTQNKGWYNFDDEGKPVTLSFIIEATGKNEAGEQKKFHFLFNPGTSTIGEQTQMKIGEELKGTIAGTTETVDGKVYLKELTVNGERYTDVLLGNGALIIDENQRIYSGHPTSTGSTGKIETMIKQNMETQTTAKVEDGATILDTDRPNMLVHYWILKSKDGGGPEKVKNTNNGSELTENRLFEAGEVKFIAEPSSRNDSFYRALEQDALQGYGAYRKTPNSGKYIEFSLKAEWTGEHEDDLKKRYDLKVDGNDLKGWTVTLSSKIQPEVSDSKEEIDFETKYEEDPNMYEGEEKVKQEGVKGTKTVTTTKYFIMENGEKVYLDETKTTEEVTKKPVDKIILRGTKKRPNTPSTPSEIVKIIFDANEGAWANGETRRVYRRAVGSTITIESAPMREGYKFLYWEGSEYYPGQSYRVEGAHTFTAMWEKDEQKPEEKPSVDSKIKTPRGSALTPEEIAKILAGMKKAVPAIPRAGVGR